MFFLRYRNECETSSKRHHSIPVGEDLLRGDYDKILDEVFTFALGEKTAGINK